jgi:hypothetical protein
VRILPLLTAVFVATSVAAQQPATQPSVPSAALTIYNQDFAVARTQVDLDLRSGLNEVTTNQVTTQLEPDSVVLRDPSLRGTAAKPSFHIVEQNYDAAVVTQDWLLQKYEGKTIDFQPPQGFLVDGKLISSPVVQGKIIRAPQQAGQYNQYGQYNQNQPLIEVDGKLQFSLPGTPLFPASTDGLLLKPTLRWQIDSEKAQKLSAELAYITGGLSWEATYNVVAPNGGDAVGKAAGSSAASEEKADIVGWVTIHNQSGTEFPQARIKLMAGDVARITPGKADRFRGGEYDGIELAGALANPQVTQKAFDDFHLYDLNRTVSLRDGEIKQIQFIEASGVTLARSYIYDGAAENRQPISNFGNNINQQRSYGLNADNTKIQIAEEFKNSESNHLGIPLPAGRIRLYRRDADGQMEFVGESTINHIPTEDTVKINTGSAFDVKGSRRQVDFHINQSDHILDETFEIKLINQKPEPVNVNVLEHLYRGDNWEVQHNSGDYTKLDSHTIQFPIQVPAKGEATLTYSVRYSW